jgi:hypothetical protein
MHVVRVGISQCLDCVQCACVRVLLEPAADFRPSLVHHAGLLKAVNAFFVAASHGNLPVRGGVSLVMPSLVTRAAIHLTRSAVVMLGGMSMTR